jgi:hypothetical protein
MRLSSTRSSTVRVLPRLENGDGVGLTAYKSAVAVGGVGLWLDGDGRELLERVLQRRGRRR